MTKKNQHIIGQADDLHQLILLDEDSRVVHSCDSLFSTAGYENSPLTSHFPFLESIFPAAKQLQPGDPPLFFSKVETFHLDLPGVYDYRFSCVLISEKRYILWVLFNYTELYEQFRTYQQRKNELEVHRQYLEQRLDRIDSVEELTRLKNKVKKYPE